MKDPGDLAGARIVHSSEQQACSHPGSFSVLDRATVIAAGPGGGLGNGRLIAELQNSSSACM
jgi:hypothetical protein